MVKKDKKKFIDDLYGRLQYGLKCRCDIWPNEVKTIATIYPNEKVLIGVVEVDLDKVKPYLRPMDTMTKDEQKELTEFMNEVKCTDEGIFLPGNDTGYVVHYSFMKKVLNWLNKHHLDYSDMIGKGFALPATENMYK